MNGNSGSLLGAIRGPVLLITLGVLFAICAITFLVTIPLPMIVPEQAERLFPPTTAPSRPARTSEARSRGVVILG